MKKLIFLFFVFSLLIISGNLFAEEKGSRIVAQKIDGQEVSGELITVKNSTLLLLSDSGADVSVDIEDVKTITIVRKSKFWKGAGYGALIGGVVGGGVGALAVDWEDESAEIGVVVMAAVGAGFGLLTGGVWGAAAGKETIQVAGMIDSEIKYTLEKLRRNARIPDYQ